MKVFRFAFALAALPLLLCGCASTPAQRIDQNRELFDSLPVAAQARIRGGQIEPGFSPEMVQLALGKPQRILVRRSRAGDSLVWLYLDVDRRYERQRADVVGISVAGAGGVRSTGGSAWINVSQEREIVRCRVEFMGGTVFAFEEIAKDPPGP